jgi:prophage maintenance system killer protein
LNRPTLELAVAFNAAVRTADEWFDEPDELDRLAKALAVIDGLEDPPTAAAILAYRVTRAQPFGEGNKRTALLLARWVLDRNGMDGSAIIPPKDRELADLLVKAASGHDVESEVVELFLSRSTLGGAAQSGER